MVDGFFKYFAKNRSDEGDRVKTESSVKDSHDMASPDFFLESVHSQLYNEPRHHFQRLFDA